MSWSPVLNKLVISNAGPLDVSDGGIALRGGISLIEADEIERAGAFEVFTAFHQHARPSGVPDGYTAIKTGLGAEVGLGTSVVWSVWKIERAEIRRIERAMLRDLDDTRVLRNQSGARFVYAKIGSRPTDRDSHPVSPFPVDGAVVTVQETTLTPVGSGIGVLGVFSADIGSTSGERWDVPAARIGFAGLVVAISISFSRGNTSPSGKSSGRGSVPPFE